MKSLKKVIIFLFLVLIIVAGLAAYAYFQTDLLKTPYQLFDKYFNNTVEQLTNYSFKPYDEIIKQLMNSNSETVVYYPDSTNTFLKTTLDTDTDGNTSAVVEYKMEGAEEPLNVYFAGSKDAIGIKIEELYDKYITIENRDLNKALENSEISIVDEDAVPESIPTLTEDDMNTIKQLCVEYKEKLISKFDEKECFIAERNVDTVVGTEVVKTSKYTFKTTKKTLASNIENVLEELCNDSRFNELYKKMYSKEATEFLEEYKKSVEENKNSEDANISISFYVSDKRTVKAEINYNESSVTLLINNTEIAINMTGMENDYNNITYDSEIRVENTYNGSTGDLIVSATKKYNKTDESSEYYTDSYFNSFSNYEDSYIKIILSTSNSNSQYKSILKYVTEENGEAENLIEMDINTNANITVEKIDSSNSTVINDFTSTDYNSLANEIIFKGYSYVEQKPKSTLAIILSKFFGLNTTLDFSDDDMMDYSEEGYLEEDDPLMLDDGNLSLDSNKSKIESELTSAIGKCLSDYQMATVSNPNANINDYLNVDNIKKGCSGYTIQLLEGGTTLKCTMNYDFSVYYAIMTFDGLSVKSVDVYTENEYREL